MLQPTTLPTTILKIGRIEGSDRAQFVKSSCSVQNEIGSRHSHRRISETSAAYRSKLQEIHSVYQASHQWV